MAMGSVVEFHEIPFIDINQCQGRFLASLNFYDAGEWRIWFSLEGGKFMESRAFPAEGFYYSKSPERQTDLCLHFLNFVAQKASFLEIRKPLRGLQDDLFNLSASLAKISHIHQTKATLGPEGGDRRMIVTEIEYFFAVCRSLFDLLQEIAAELWEGVEIHGLGPKEKRKLQKSFSKMVLHKGLPTSFEDLEARYGLPRPMAEFYIRHMEFFFTIRNFRDTIIHHGSPVQTIFSTEDGYLIFDSFRPFSTMDVWSENEKNPNGLVPLMPALAIVAYKTICVCEDFTRTLEQVIQFPDPMVPNMNLYMRSYFDKHFVAALSDAERRLERI